MAAAASYDLRWVSFGDSHSRWTAPHFSDRCQGYAILLCQRAVSSSLYGSMRALVKLIRVYHVGNCAGIKIL